MFLTTAGFPADTTAELVRQATHAAKALDEVPFKDVVHAATGREILPLDPGELDDLAFLRELGQVMDRVLLALNAPDHPAHSERRINEVSRHLEDAILAAINETEHLACALPVTAARRIQRSGYPDLRVVDRRTGRIAYLDPKLFESGNRTSSLRTFYFEPGDATNKILDDAHHLIVGVEHGGKTDGAWRFLKWELVDASRFTVRLKVEFQASNRELYGKATIVASGDDAER